jgi:spore maturation protein CgeB
VKRLSYVVLGLSITSSWGNGHATTYRGLLKALAARGHRVLFLERDVEYYASNRDLPSPPYATTELYRDLPDLGRRFTAAVKNADVVIVGSFVPEGARVATWVLGTARGVTAFYDIDTPVTLAALEQGGAPYLAPELVPRFDLYLSFTGGPTLDRLEQRFRARRARPLYCSVDPEEHRPIDGEAGAARRWDLGYLGTYDEDRQRGLTHLLLAPARRDGARRFVVAGPQYPASIAWPANVERLDHVAPCDHRAFYGAQRFTLNLTRQRMLEAGFSPSVRLFEAAACGVPVISDRWPGLADFFEPGREILVADRAEDVRRILATTSEAERDAVGARARARVLAEHTGAHRAATLDRYVREVAGHPGIEEVSVSAPEIIDP